MNSGKWLARALSRQKLSDPAGFGAMDISTPFGLHRGRRPSRAVCLARHRFGDRAGREISVNEWSELRANADTRG